jgi:Ni,Fe-hydrogenase I large subunit
MSANRSVQAAQRRRAGPPETTTRSTIPQPSINSAQLFANQARSGPGPNIPNGRLAGQQAAFQQKQMQQQMLSKESKDADKLSSVNKMTITQAITLITLRLGAIETKLMHNDKPEGNMNMNMDAEIMSTIMERLNELETRSSNTNTNTNSNSNSNSSLEIALLKQQIEAINKSLTQNKGNKEVNNLKTQIEEMRNELNQTKELLSILQNVVLENSKKILDLSMCNNEEDYEEQNEIVGNDLKEMIENELNDEEEQ